MSIKSEKAKHYVDNHSHREVFENGRSLTTITLGGATKGIELAESDARERAVRAYRMACNTYDDGRDMCWLDGSMCNLGCNQAVSFLKHYDNE